MAEQANKSKVHPDELSPAVIRKLQAIQKKYKAQFHTVKEAYMERINDDFVRLDSQFKTEAEREEYALGLTEHHIMQKKCKLPKRLPIYVED